MSRKKKNKYDQILFIASQVVVAIALLYVLFPYTPPVTVAANPVVELYTKPRTKEDDCNLDKTIEALNTSVQKPDKLNPCVTVTPQQVIQNVPNAVQIGYEMAAARGWTGAQWNALYIMWMRESGWNPNSVNRSSGACGIPQAYPCSKIPDKSTQGQIKWGLDYIQRRYGSPLNAWAWWQAHHSY